MNFIRRSNRGNLFICQTTVIKFGDLLGGWNLTTKTKFQLNISKTTTDRPKHKDMGCKYH